MAAGKLSVLIIAAMVAGAAQAQVPRGYSQQGVDQQRLENNANLNAKRYDDGVKALQAKNYGVAEGIFQDILRENPNHADANFMLGVTKMSQSKWDEAKPFLETATKKNPKEPDPKSRLGVTLAKLGDVEGAKKQREELEKMQKACKLECRNAQWIDGGIAMIDAALAPKS